MASCIICGKSKTIGNNVSHANNKTKKQVFPNLQQTKIVIGKSTKKAYVCTRCLRSGKAKKVV